VNAAGPADADDPRLAPLTAVALALPEAKRERGDRHATFRVRGRAFAYVLVDHHGDGIVGLVVKAPPAVAESLIDEEPDRFYRPAYVGHRGWVGLRLDAGEVDDDQVTGLVVESYRLCAPKSLARAIT